ncbi:MAG TPA: type II toxin-antitoxin system VapB family antitoxin [Rhizobiaceae bacterium]|nr:type II toxin-antitoxin system VapB family antitoxin [Rhizobiaceae bacterium]
MAFHIKNPRTDELARKVAKAKGVSLTAAVHQALEHEYKRETGRSDFVERTMEIARRMREKGDPAKGLPADKEFIDSLYE